MKRRNRSAVTLVEAIVVMCIALPLMYVVWQSFVTTRQTEKATISLGAALRGASVLEGFLRRDLAGADLASSLCTIDIAAGRLTLHLAGPATPIAHPSVVYQLEAIDALAPTGPYYTQRDGRRLQNVILRRFKAELIEARSSRWLCVELVTLDPGLSKKRNGQYYEYRTTLLIPAPNVSLSPSFQSFALAPSFTGVDGWVEGMDSSYVYLAASNPDNPSNFPGFVARVDGTEYPLIFFDPLENHIENTGTQPYIKLSFDYHEALGLLLGPSYMSQAVALAFGAKDPETGTVKWFYDQVFYPSPIFDMQAGEVRFDRFIYWDDPIEPGLDIYLTSTGKPGRSHYEVSYGGDVYIARSIADGVYHTFINDFPENGKRLDVKIDGL